MFIGLAGGAFSSTLYEDGGFLPEPIVSKPGGQVGECLLRGDGGSIGAGRFCVRLFCSKLGWFSFSNSDWLTRRGVGDFAADTDCCWMID